MSEKQARIINLTPNPEATDAASEITEGTDVVMIPFRRNTHWGYCSPDKKILIPCTYELTSAFSEGLSALSMHEKWGYINKAGKQVIPFKYDFAGSFREGKAPVCIKDKYGFIDTTGNLVIKAEYNFAAEFENGMAMVEQKGKYGYIDLKGTLVIPCKYDGLSPFKNGVAFVEHGNKEFFIDKTGKEVPEPEEPDYFDGFAVDFSDDEETFGFIDEKGKMLTPYVYEMVNDFADGMAAVCLNEKWGFIDTTGKLVIGHKYEDILEDFHNGLAIVETGFSDFGYIDKKGTEYWD